MRTPCRLANASMAEGADPTACRPKANGMLKHRTTQQATLIVASHSHSLAKTTSTKKRLVNFPYNVDRTVASLFGAPPQEPFDKVYCYGEQDKGDIASVPCKGPDKSVITPFSFSPSSEVRNLVVSLVVTRLSIPS